MKRRARSKGEAPSLRLLSRRSSLRRPIFAALLAHGTASSLFAPCPPPLLISYAFAPLPASTPLQLIVFIVNPKSQEVSTIQVGKEGDVWDDLRER